MIKQKKAKKSVAFRNFIILFLVANFAVFLIYPIIRAFLGSFHDWNPLIDKYDFVGLNNYKSMFKEPLLWKSLANAFIYSIVCCFFRVFIGLGIAVLLHSKLVKFKSFFQGVFYVPTITPLVAVSFVWVWMFNPQFGLINKIFNLDIAWLKNSHYALIAVMIMTIWKDFGYATVIFLGGLMGISEEIYEAAEIDGASGFQQLINITWPLLKPTTFFVVVTSFIGYFQAYVPIMVMTKGGPGTSTYVISYLIYDQAFQKYNFGNSAAMSFLLFAIVGILTGIMFRSTGQGGIDNA